MSTRFGLRAFLWLMSILVFVWLIFSIVKFRECPPITIINKENYEIYGEIKNLRIENEITTPIVPVPPKPKRIYSYNRELPILFIVGIPGSGLELMRNILNRNPYIRCAGDTEIISNLIMRRNEWTNSKIEKERLMHAGMSDSIIDDAVTAFILEAILKQGRIANLLCNKDINIFNHAKYVNRLFPNAKFLLMIRDARSTVDSLINKRIYYKGVNSNNDYKETLKGWNVLTTDFYNNCKQMGPSTCKIVFYEKLILETKSTLKKVVNFLDIENLFGKGKLYKNLTESPTESLEIINVDLFKWQRRFPTDLLENLDELAPVMKKLGYNTSYKLQNKFVYSKLSN